MSGSRHNIFEANIFTNKNSCDTGCVLETVVLVVTLTDIVCVQVSVVHVWARTTSHCQRRATCPPVSIATLHNVTSTASPSCLLSGDSWWTTTSLSPPRPKVKQIDQNLHQVNVPFTSPQTNCPFKVNIKQTIKF